MKHPDSFVSVIIPVYNGERFLAEAVHNVQSQNYDPLEIIIVDDGSTDRTAVIASQFYNKVRYRYQPNRGPSSARNRGIMMAAGNVIAFLDVDDLWSSDKLELQINYLASHPAVEIVQGLIQEMELDHECNENALIFKESSKPYYFVNLGSAIFRKSVFDKVGLFDESLRRNEDTDWFFRAWENNISKVVLHEVTLFYRKHNNNLTLQEQLVHFGLVRLFKKHLDRLQERGDDLAAKPSRGLQHLSEYLGWMSIALKKML